MKSKVNKLLSFFYKYRFAIAVTIFIFCVLFELNGSSIGYWNNFVNSNVKDDGVLLGISRGIRSDEWATLTPMTFSQKFNNFNYFNSIVRGTSTDIFIVYGLPVFSIFQVFRPFQLGYLFLGVSRGLSFFWYGRLIALFMVTFEFLMIFTKGKKNLSFIGAILVALAPTVQWWFAVCGMAELFIFGELALILLYKYMNDDNIKKRILYLFLMIICAGGYLLIMYPSWQIPMFYVFLALAVWIIIENRKNCKISKVDIISIIIALIIFIVSMSCVLLKSYDTIQIIMNTVYPGSRLETGGKVLTNYFSNFVNLFLPIKKIGMEGTNPCELSTFFSLFPIGIILSIFCIIKNKKKDIAIICLFVPYVILGMWCIFGFPSIFAKITLLSNSQSTRAFLAVGYMDILLLIRALSIHEMNMKKTKAILVSIISSILLVLICILLNKNYFFSEGTKRLILMTFIMIIIEASIIYLIFTYKQNKSKIFLCVEVLLLMLFMGGTVNPIRRGVDVIYESNIIKQVQKINEDDKGLWIVEGIRYPVSNYIIMAGAPTINSTNIYPDIEKWHLLDNEKKYEDIYNRYAHIDIDISSEYKDRFELLQPDYFKVFINPNELQILNVKYIFTINNLEKYNTDSVNFENIYSYNEYLIYKVIYNS